MSGETLVLKKNFPVVAGTQTRGLADSTGIAVSMPNHLPSHLLMAEIFEKEF